VVIGAVDVGRMDTISRPHRIRRGLAAMLAVALVATLGPGPASADAAVSAPSPFKDVAASSPHAPAIGLMAAAQITLGCAPDRFCPNAQVSRAQVASLMARTLGIGQVQRTAFQDVSAASTHAGNINALAARGVLQGCAPAKYCPARSVTRAQMASILARAFDLRPTGAHGGFRDARTGVHAPSIQALADAGITVGCSDDRFCGDDPVTRAQFTSLLVRAAEELVVTAANANRGKGNNSKGGNGKSPTDPVPPATTDPTPPATTDPTPPATTDPVPPPSTDPVPPPATDPTPPATTDPTPPATTDPTPPGTSDPAEPLPPPTDPVPPPATEPGVAAELTRVSVGTPTPTGTLTHNSGSYRLSGAGADIWGTSDSFEFAHRSVSGDTSALVRVDGQTRTHGWAKAGLMMRSDTIVGSAHVSLVQTPDNGVSLQYRPVAGGLSQHISVSGVSTPTWLRLDRTGNTFTGYSSGDGTNWRSIGTITAAVAATALVGLAVTSHNDGVLSSADFSGFRLGPVSPSDPGPTTSSPTAAAASFLYSSADVTRIRAMMAGGGPFFNAGDAGHGGIHSPGDGVRSVKLANEFLANPQASYWVQPDLPYSSGDPWPQGMQYARPMNAAWVYMTQPGHPNRDALRREVKSLLLHHASHPSHDYSNSTNYPVNYPGFVPSPSFNTAHWMSRLIKARDMIGRDAFTAAENATVDRWFYDYANWAFKFLHHESYVKKTPGREQRDYTRITTVADAHRRSYDGGPLIGSLAMAYTNRHAAVASAASLAANYLKHHTYTAPTTGGPAYGRFTVDQLLLHSRLFVEETIRFSVYPQGVQGDFERGDRNFHGAAPPQQGWLYSVNVLANLVEMAEFHAKRGDMSVWNYATTAGYDGTAGVPVAGGFTHKNLHFYAWSISRYVNNGWGRTNGGQPLALPSFYHDVIPAATVARFAPNDALLRAAWQRSGSNFPAYPQSPQSQGSWSAHLGEGAKAVGLIEQANGSALTR
jgi:regulation of enolase protein 1 (concanavalin A-like superfamily)